MGAGLILIKTLSSVGGGGLAQITLTDLENEIKYLASPCSSQLHHLNILSMHIESLTSLILLKFNYLFCSTSPKFDSNND
jgi:hypothetical protein